MKDIIIDILGGIALVIMAYFFILIMGALQGGLV
jgi:hypothetical protein